jgi:hypothetical protein
VAVVLERIDEPPVGEVGRVAMTGGEVDGSGPRGDVPDLRIGPEAPRDQAAAIDIEGGLAQQLDRDVGAVGEAGDEDPRLVDVVVGADLACRRDDEAQVALEVSRVGVPGVHAEAVVVHEAGPGAEQQEPLVRGLVDERHPVAGLLWGEARLAAVQLSV